MKKYKNTTSLILWVAVVLWMMFILSLSSQVAEQSDQLSKGVTEAIVKIIRIMVPSVELDINTLNILIRKGFHFFAFSMLGILTTKALLKSGINRLQSAFIALFICVLFAIVDETYQLFVPGRGGQMSDVLLDSSGAITGIVLFLLSTYPKPLKSFILKLISEPINENN